MCPEVAGHRVVPEEEGLVRFHLLLHKTESGGSDLLVNGFHPLLGQRAGVFNGLLSYSSPAGICCCVILFSGDAVQNAPGIYWLLQIPDGNELVNGQLCEFYRPVSSCQFYQYRTCLLRVRFNRSYVCQDRAVEIIPTPQRRAHVNAESDLNYFGCGPALEDVFLELPHSPEIG